MSTFGTVTIDIDELLGTEDRPARGYVKFVPSTTYSPDIDGQATVIREVTKPLGKDVVTVQLQAGIVWTATFYRVGADIEPVTFELEDGETIDIATITPPTSEALEVTVIYNAGLKADKSALDAESAARAAADTALDVAIDDEADARAAGDAAINTELEGRLSEESLNGAYETRSADPVVTLSDLPTDVLGKTAHSGRSYNQDSITSGGGYEFAAHYDPSGNLILNKRSLPNGSWSTFDMSTISGNPIGTVADDSHCIASIICDDDGYLHVAANMHGNALKYVRSTNPYDISVWTAPGMIGAQETSVTYPRFALAPNGNLYFLYREGNSTAGAYYLNVWNGTAWSRVVTLADIAATSNQPYESRFIIDDDGTMHLAFSWKTSGGTFNQVHEVDYIKSTNGGTTWTNIAGTVVTLPFTFADTSARVLETADTNSGILNQYGLAVDTYGRPHIALTLATGSTPDRNLHHIYWDGDSWVTVQVTDLGNGFGYDDRPMRPDIVCTPDGRTFIIATFARVFGKQDTVWLIDVTDDANPIWSPLVNMTTREFEITHDQRALRDRNMFACFIHAANEEATVPSPEYWHVNNWTRQYGGVLHLDLNRLSAVTRRETRPPRIRTVATSGLADSTTVTATSDTVLTALPPLLTTPDLRGKRAFVRLSSRAAVTGGTFTLTLYEVQQGGSNQQVVALTFTSSSTALRVTPWMPLRYGPRLNGDDYLRVMGKVNTSQTGTLTGLILEVGVLD